MRMDDYERLLDSSWGEPLEDMSEREMMDKVNRDIAYWKSCHEDEEDGKGKDCCCSGCGHTDESLVSEQSSDIPVTTDFMDFDDEDFVEEEVLNAEPTVEPIVEKETMPMSQNIPESKPEELPEDEADTFLLEPV